MTKIIGIGIQPDNDDMDSWMKIQNLILCGVLVSNTESGGGAWLITGLDM